LKLATPLAQETFRADKRETHETVGDGPFHMKGGTFDNHLVIEIEHEHHGDEKFPAFKVEGGTSRAYVFIWYEIDPTQKKPTHRKGHAQRDFSDLGEFSR
jgi:hypothetical protein